MGKRKTDVPDEATVAKLLHIDNTPTVPDKHLDSEEDSDSPATRSEFSSDEVLHRSKLVELFCSIYTLLMSISGMVLPLTITVTRKAQGVQHYHEKFELYMFITSIGFMTFIFGKHLKQNVRRMYQQKRARVSITGSLHGPQTQYTELDGGILTHSPSMGNINASNVLQPRPSIALQKKTSEPALVPLDENNYNSNIEGITGYVMAGALVFALGSLSFNVIRIAQYIKIKKPTYEQVFLPTISVVQFVYVILHTLFIFRYHRAVIRENQAFIKAGFSHLIATNLFMWLTTMVHETEEDYKYSSLGTNATSGGEAEHLVSAMSAGHGGELDLVNALSPYLTPCMIEYSMCGAVVSYSIYCNIGRQTHSAYLAKKKSGIDIHDSMSSETKLNLKKYMEDSLCPQSDRGALACALPLVATIIAVIAAVINQGSEGSDTIYSLTQQILLGVCIVATIAGLNTMQKLSSVIDIHHGFLDILLLVVTLSGNYAFQTLVFIASVNGLTSQHIYALPLAKSVMSLFQSTLQTAFILDSLKRRVHNVHLATVKPGRFIIMFILVCNVSIWIVMTFGVKTHGKSKFTEFYGREAWVIIAHVFSPMTIFYRFHSSVLLADIWLEAYEFHDPNNPNHGHGVFTT